MSDQAILSAVQTRALEGLATYRFLTVELMQRIGVGRDPKNLRASLDSLLGRRWIGRTEDVPFMPGVGRLPHLYWLRPAGAEVLAELHSREPPPAVKGLVTAVMELPHRLAIIETHIALRQWAEAAGAAVDWFKGDYDPGADRLQKATTLPYDGGRYTPDALAQVTLADGKARLLVVEVYRGGRDGTLDHFRRKLPELREVAESQAVEKHHNAPRAARFLVLFSDEVMRQGALRRWPETEQPVWARFFVKAMGDLADFAGDWWHPGQDRRPLFG